MLQCVLLGTALNTRQIRTFLEDFPSSPVAGGLYLTGVLGSILVGGTRSHMRQLSVAGRQLKNPHVVMKLGSSCTSRSGTTNKISFETHIGARNFPSSTPKAYTWLS